MKLILAAYTIKCERSDRFYLIGTGQHYLHVWAYTFTDHFKVYVTQNIKHESSSSNIVTKGVRRENVIFTRVSETYVFLAF